MASPDRAGILPATPENIRRAAAAVRAGELVVIPTETVYGVAARAETPAAMAKLYAAKGREESKRVALFADGIEAVRRAGGRVEPLAEKLAAAFWPGPLTLILAAPPSLHVDLGDRGDTIAVRVPDHDFTRELLRRTGPLAVSSANVSGQEAALTASDAAEQLDDAVSVYLDAGPTSGPAPSTIVDLSGPTPRLLRAGRLSVAEINAVVPGLLPDEPDASA